MSISGPYVFPTTNNSGAAYSGDPQWVCKGLSRVQTLLRPKSAKEKKMNVESFLRIERERVAVTECTVATGVKAFEVCDTAWVSSDDLRVTRI